jgi:hypothetical protein
MIGYLRTNLYVIDDVDDRPFSGKVLKHNKTDIVNCLTYEQDSFTLDALDTGTLTPPTEYSTTKSAFLLVYCIGNVTVTVNHKNSLAADVASVFVTKGDVTIPGFMACSYQNIVSVDVTGVDPSSQVVAFWAKVGTIAATTGSGLNVGLETGHMPIGGIIPLSGVFDGGGIYDETGIFPIPGWLKQCDGSIINDPDSPINGKFVPQISDGRVLEGSAGGGNYGVSSSSADILTGFGGDWNVISATVGGAASVYTTRYFMRIK